MCFAWRLRARCGFGPAVIVIGALDREAPNARTLSEGPLTRYKPNHFLKAPNGFHGVGLGAEHLASLGEAVEEDANFLEPLGGKGSASPEAAFASRKTHNRGLQSHHRIG